MYRFLTVPFLLFNLFVYKANAQTQDKARIDQLEIPATDYDIRFTWLGDTVNAKWEPYSALLIPVHLPGCPKEFFMQFDLGAPHSLFYVNKLKAIRIKYPKSCPVITDTSKTANLAFLVGGQNIQAEAIGLKDIGDPAFNWINKSKEIIGTLGVDLITDRTLVLDYPAERLSICMEVPGTLSKQVNLPSFMLIQGSILLPGVILGKQTLLYFDTGSSAFELLTSKEACTALALPNSAPVAYQVKSWGKTLIANTMPTPDSLLIATQMLPIRNATYIEGASDSQVQQMLKLGIGGMIGNKLFLNNTLILDTKNKKFGLIARKAQN